MFEFFTLVLFVLLCFGTLRLSCRIAWGMVKVIALILLAVATLILVACFLMAGGLLILLPVGLMVLSFCLLRAAL